MANEAAIAFTVDFNMEYALHVASSSLLRHLHPDWHAHFFLLLEGFSTKRIDLLRRTLDRAQRPYRITLLPALSAATFRGFRPFYGVYSNYFRLFLPQMVDVPRLLYLDPDILVRMDVRGAFEANMQGCALGAVCDGIAKQAGDGALYRQLGMADDQPVFNAGVLLMDNERWKAEQRTEQLLEFCRQGYTGGDQVALNSVFRDGVCRLPREYNVALYPPWTAPTPPEGIFHLIGPPKPWDLLGSLFNPYARAFREEATHTVLSHAMWTKYLQPRSYLRVYRIKGGYLNVMKQRLRQLRGAAQSRLAGSDRRA